MILINYFRTRATPKLIYLVSMTIYLATRVQDEQITLNTILDPSKANDLRMFIHSYMICVVVYFHIYLANLRIFWQT